MGKILSMVDCVAVLSQGSNIEHSSKIIRYLSVSNENLFKMQYIYRRVGTLFHVNKILFAQQSKQVSKLYEPEYLESMKSKIPLYDTLNIQLKSYDYPVLESFQKCIHNLLKNVDVSVEECWATPAQHTHIIRYKAKSCVVDSEYNVRQYERNIQIVDVNATQFSILLRILHTSLPEGVVLNIHKHEDYHEEIRYVPDKELIELKTQLDDMTVVTSKKK